MTLENISLMRLSQLQQVGKYNVYSKAAVTASCSECAQEGLKILIEGGSGVDCAITTLLCAGVKHPARLGVGGGFVATIYNQRQRNVRVLLSRECAPLRASPQMFTTGREALFGGKAVAVPGSLRGYWEMHQKYGKLPWKRLFEPALRMCLEGTFVEPFTYYGMQQVEKEIYKTKTLKEIMVDPFSGRSKTQKHKIFRKNLAKTLQLVAYKGPEVLYRGELTENFVKDVENAGGIITVEDMNKYKPKWMMPLRVKIPELKLNVYSTPPPCSGAILLFVLEILSKYCPLKGFNPSEQWHRIVESLKHAYGFRTKLGDPDKHPQVVDTIREMLNENTFRKVSDKLQATTSNDFKDYGGDYIQQTDLGTFHFNILSPEGDAVCVTETINTLFGSLVQSKSTGIILNNTMNDFSYLKVKNEFGAPPTKTNLIAPGKVPLSSMVPTIVTNNTNSEVKLIIGGAGGTKIISAVSQVLARHLLLGEDLQVAVDQPRLHHQLMPMQLEYESEFSDEILHQLWLRGHQLLRMKRHAVVSVINRSASGGKLEAIGDFRRHSGNAGF